MNPWKIIGWIVLLVIVLLLAFCSLILYRVGSTAKEKGEHKPGYEQPKQPAPVPLSVKVISFECIASTGRDKAEMTIRNTSTSTIEFARLFVEFKNEDGSVKSAADSFFRPHDIPPGSLSSATVYSNGGGAYTCAPSAIQDRDGLPVSFAK